jgi:hypothetical protein
VPDWRNAEVLLLMSAVPLWLPLKPQSASVADSQTQAELISNS